MPQRFRRLGPPTPPPPEEEPNLWERMGGLRGLTAGGTRIVSGVASSPGGWLGAGISGGGEALAQMIEEGDITAPFHGEGTGRIAAEAAIGAIPFAKVFRAGQPIAASALRGALYGGGGEVMREAAREGKIDPASVIGHTAFGGGVGALMGKFMPGPGAPAGPVHGPMTYAETIAQRKAKSDAMPAPMRKLQEMFEDATSKRDIKDETAAMGHAEDRWTAVQKANAAAAAKAEVERLARIEQDAARTKYLAERAGKTRGESKVTDTYVADTPGGTKRVVIPYRKIKTKGESAGTGGAGTPPGTAPSGPGSPDLPGGGPPPPGTGNPFVDAAVAASRRGASGAPEPFNPPRLVPVSEVPPVPPVIEQPGLGTLTPTEGRSHTSGGAPDLTDAEFLAAVTKPVETVVEPAVARSSVEPLELTKDVDDILERTGVTVGQRPYEPGHVVTSPPQGIVRSAVESTPDGKLDWGTRNEFGPGPTKVPKVQTPSANPKGKLYGADVTTPEVKAEGASGARPMTPEEVAREQSFIDRLKNLDKGPKDPGDGGTTLSAMGAGQLSNVLRIARENPQLASRLGMGAAGAVVGGMIDPLDDPLASAAVGGAAGLAAPSAIRLLQQAVRSPNLDPDGRAVAGILASPDGPQEMAKSVWSALPQYFRANYLMTPNILNNVVSGPLGAGVTGAIEAHLAGDPRGAALLSALRPDRWARRFTSTWERAQQATGGFERAGGEAIGEAPTMTRKALASPGTVMTMGDMTTREIGESVGFTTEEMRKMTMTNEPEFNFMRRLADLPRSSTVGQIALPFSRTLANIVEQGSMRLPGIGSIVQANRAVPDAFKTQMIQQGVGGAAGLAGFGAGYYAPEDPTALRMTRGFTSNFAGRAALPAAMGFAAGRAFGQGGTVRDVGKASVTEGLRALPLPTIETPEEWSRYLFAEPGEGVLPRSAVPGILREAYEYGLPAQNTPAPTAPAQPRPSRYRRR